MDNINIIKEVEINSIAYELGIEKGDALISINEMEIVDVLDYRYLIKDDYVELLIEKKNKEYFIYEIEKEVEEDLGIIFEKELMDDARACKNKCIFCFIDQLPKNMRKSLYFKDDDARLSFLEGNYVTLTNMTEEDLNRIIFYHLSPINISVHSTDEYLRTKMLKNKDAKNILEYIQKIYDAKIDMNFQIVLCKNINDKNNLDKSITDLSKFIKRAKSLSVVPVGLTKYRDNLEHLESFTKEDAKDVINKINYFQNKFRILHGTRFVYASDEFYLKANIDLPKYEEYEDFPQIENGVGMLTNFKHEFYEEFKKLRLINSCKEVSVITGEASYEFISSLSKEIENRYFIKINVYSIKNIFFGENITVTGLITGKDIINQLKGKSLGEKIFISRNSLKRDEDIFLDDVKVTDIEEIFSIKVVIIENGADFLLKICS